MASPRSNSKRDVVELEDVMDAIKGGLLDINKLWEATGRGDYAQAATLLFRAGYDLGDNIGAGDVKKVTVVATPDDLIGMFYRVWVTF